MDLQNEKLPSCILQCILFQVEPRLSFVSRFLKRIGMIQKKITCISQRVVTLLVQRTSRKIPIFRIFYSFWTSGQALGSSTGYDDFIRQFQAVFSQRTSYA